MGNVDAGKSTLLGVLTHGELDNGRGLARMKLFRHKHEMESGRTSSVGNDILGFDATGKVVNKSDHGHLDWVKICEQSAKVREISYIMVYSYMCLFDTDCDSNRSKPCFTMTLMKWLLTHTTQCHTSRH